MMNLGLFVACAVLAVSMGYPQKRDESLPVPAVMRVAEKFAEEVMEGWKEGGEMDMYKQFFVEYLKDRKDFAERMGMDDSSEEQGGRSGEQGGRSEGGRSEGGRSGEGRDEEGGRSGEGREEQGGRSGEESEERELTPEVMKMIFGNFLKFVKMMTESGEMEKLSRMEDQEKALKMGYEKFEMFSRFLAMKRGDDLSWIDRLSEEEQREMREDGFKIFKVMTKFIKFAYKVGATWEKMGDNDMERFEKFFEKFMSFAKMYKAMKKKDEMEEKKEKVFKAFVTFVKFAKLAKASGFADELERMDKEEAAKKAFGKFLLFGKMMAVKEGKDMSEWREMSDEDKQEKLKEGFKLFVMMCKFAKYAKATGYEPKGDNPEEMVKNAFKKFVQFAEMAKRVMNARGDSSSSESSEEDRGRMDASEDGMEGANEMLMKIKVKALWAEMLEWDKSFESGLKALDKKMSKKDTARVFYELFLRMKKSFKAIESKARKASYVVKEVAESQQRGREEREKEEQKKAFREMMEQSGW